MYKTRAKRDKKGKIIHEVLVVNESVYKIIRNAISFGTS